MNLKKTTITAMPLLWLFFLVLDFMTKIMAGMTLFKRFQPFVVITRGVQSVKRLSVFALIIMNIFLLWKWVNHTRDRGES